MERKIEIRKESAKSFFSSCDMSPECAVPLVITQNSHITSFEIYDDFLKLLKKDIEKIAKVPFSRHNLDFLDSLATPYLLSHGYERDKYGLYRWYYSFLASSEHKTSTEHIQMTTRLVDCFYNSCVSFDGELLYKRKAPTFATIIDNTIVSLATINDFDDEASILEITTETAVNYRNKGYATSNVEALSSYLVGKGYKVAYCVSRYNTHSIALAKKAGFALDGKFYAISGYKIH